MKRLLILSILLGSLSLLPLFAQSDSTAVAETMQGGVTTEVSNSADPRTLMQEAAHAYGEKKYGLAISIYQRALASTTEPTAELYYNLGCAYYKDGQLAQAILNHERAYRLDPSDSDIRYNLNFLSERTAEKIEVPRTQMLSRAIDRVTHWFSLPVWMTLSVVSFAALVVLILLYVLGTKVLHRRIGFYGGLVALLLCVVFNIFAHRSHRFIYDRSEAILTAPVVTLQSSPDSSSEDIAVVHEGHKVILMDEVGGYSEIKLADGTIGWVPADAYELINNFHD